MLTELLEFRFLRVELFEAFISISVLSLAKVCEVVSKSESEVTAARVKHLLAKIFLVLTVYVVCNPMYGLL